MKNNTVKGFLIIFFSLIAFVTQAQKPYSMKSYSMTVSGTSSLHDWTSDITKVEWMGKILVEGNKLKSAKDVMVKIPVTSIKSTKGKIMDEKTYEAFKSDKNPIILYKLIKPAASPTGLNSTGVLSMAGVVRTVALASTVKVQTNGDVVITGSIKLNMRDYNMEPPTAVMGTIKVGEMVTINYTLVLQEAKTGTK